MTDHSEISAGNTGAEEERPATLGIEVVDSITPAEPQNEGQPAGIESDVAKVESRVLLANKSLEKFHATYNKDIVEIRKTIDELRADKISFITVSGIFVAIFTFISVEVQIFNHLNNTIQVAGFTCLFSGILMIFISLLDYVARAWISDNKKYSHILIVLSFATVLIYLGIWIVSWSWALK